MADLVAIQQAEIATLRERIRQLEGLLVPEAVAVPEEWRLGNAERRVFAALTQRDIVTKEYLYVALYSDRRDLDRDPDLAMVESHVSKLKKKLSPFGVTITSARFVGYSLRDRQKYVTPPVPAVRREARVLHG